MSPESGSRSKTDDRIAEVAPRDVDVQIVRADDDAVGRAHAMGVDAPSVAGVVEALPGRQLAGRRITVEFPECVRVEVARVNALAVRTDRNSGRLQEPVDGRAPVERSGVAEASRRPRLLRDDARCRVAVENRERALYRVAVVVERDRVDVLAVRADGGIGVADAAAIRALRHGWGLLEDAPVRARLLRQLADARARLARAERQHDKQCSNSRKRGATRHELDLRVRADDHNRHRDHRPAGASNRRPTPVQPSLFTLTPSTNQIRRPSG